MHKQWTGATLALALGVVSTAAAQQGVSRLDLPEDPTLRNMPLVVVSDPAGGTYDAGSNTGYYVGGPPLTQPAPPFSFPGTPATGQLNARYQTPFGTGFDGVARLLVSTPNGTSGCTGSLLANGFDILTAAHCVSPLTLGASPTGVNVGFLNSGGGVTTIAASGWTIMPGYNGAVVNNNDLAIVRLSRQADSWMTRYNIFEGNPMDRDHIIAGYGLSGNSTAGSTINTLFDAVPVRRQAMNRFETNRDQTVNNGNSLLISTDGSTSGPILIADFDAPRQQVTMPVTGQTYNAWTLQNANGLCNSWQVNTAPVPGTLSGNPSQPIGTNPAGLSAAQIARVCGGTAGTDALFEGLIGSGDSGGPAFINNNGQLEIVGVASFGNVTCVPDQRQRLDPTTGILVSAPRTSTGCSTGFISIGGRGGFQSGHVWANGLAQRQFINATVAPEPSTWALLATGLAGLGLAARRRTRR